MDQNSNASRKCLVTPITIMPLLCLWAHLARHIGIAIHRVHSWGRLLSTLLSQQLAYQILALWHHWRRNDLFRPWECHCFDLGVPTLQRCEVYISDVSGWPHPWHRVTAAQRHWDLWLPLCFPEFRSGCPWSSLRVNEKEEENQGFKSDLSWNPDFASQWLKDSEIKI